MDGQAARARRLTTEGAVRAAGAGLALVAAAIHLALGAVDLIPGEPTRGWPFLAMGAGYLACAAGALLRRASVDVVIALWSVGLVLAYATTRADLPIEPIGITTKIAESLLALITGALAVRALR